jgi:release factor glutamine methyltransferase
VTLSELLSKTARILADAGKPDARLEAEVLIRHILSIDRARFFASLQEAVSASDETNISKLALRRADGEPLAYLTGHREFYGLDLEVNPHVLIPRQETETLVDLALDFVRSTDQSSPRIVDVGTGSGAIILALGANLPQASLFASDIDPEALQTARRNAERHGLSDRLRLISCDLLSAVTGEYDLVTANLLYVPSAVVNGLSVELRHEPRHALDGGVDGADVIRRLIRQLPPLLAPEGCVLLELDPGQTDTVSSLLAEALTGSQPFVRKDLAGFDRFVQVIGWSQSR